VEPIYEQFAENPVVISGPEFAQDLSYFLVHNCQELRQLEREIPCNEFLTGAPSDDSKQAMEFRIIQKISSHKDHAANFFVSAFQQFKMLNRHKDVLPYNHSRVRLKQNPYI
jgi:protein tyrosine phosphatase